MRTFIAVSIATLCACIAPVMVFGIGFLALGGNEALRVLPLALFVASVVSLAHVLALGVPVAAWLIYTSRFTFLRMLCAGVIVGMLPLAIWAHPYRDVGTGASSSVNGRPTLIDGQTTLAGWIDYLQMVGLAAAFGAIAATAFFVAYRSIRPNYAFQRKPLRGSAELGC